MPLANTTRILSSNRALVLSPSWFLPADASAHGPALDRHLLLNLWIALALLALAHIILLLGLLARRHPAQKSLLRIEYLPLAALAVLFAVLTIRAERLWAATRYTGASLTALQVEATGVQFAWYFRYPGPDATFGVTRPQLVAPGEGNPLGLDPNDPHSADDEVTSELVLPANREVDLRLNAQDVIHGFSIPELRLKQNAVPGQTIHIHFTPTTLGTYAILCTQLCGLGHYRMNATLRILPPAEFTAWLAAHKKGVNSMTPNPKHPMPQPQNSAKRPLLSAPYSLFPRFTDHRTIGIQYLSLALISVIIGALLSLMMRIHLVWPVWPLPLHGPILPEDYLALVTIHGTIMLFFVLTTAPQAGFSNLILPAQIGTRQMAFPVLNAASFWLTALALLTLLSSTFVPGGAAISSWTAYPPLSAVPSAGPGQGLGMDLWLISIALFAIASTASSINTLTTIIRHRCPGMTWERLPLTVWGWFTAALLSILAFSVLLAAILLLLCDRHAHTSFFLPAGDLVNGIMHTGGDGSPLLWLHLFWFFGHPEVYLAILPGLGLTSMLLANFCHRKVFAYRTMIVTTLLIGFLGILLWGHHMFVAGLNPFASSAFSVSTMAIALPASAKVLSWLATTWRSRPQYTTAMLFSLGFVSLFITGGLTGPILAQPILDEYLHNTFFVVAHFHLIMAMAGIFGLYAATYYWFPLLSATRNHPGRLLSEPLGRLHFWLTLIGAYAVFLPMHLTGLAGEPRHYAQLTGIPGAGGALSPTGLLLAHTIPLNLHITYAAIFLVTAQLLFLFNLFHSLRKGPFAASNPWQATTLEWHPALNPFSPLPASDTPEVTVHRAPCHYFSTELGDAFLPQWVQHTVVQPSIEDTTNAKPE